MGCAFVLLSVALLLILSLGPEFGDDLLKFVNHIIRIKDEAGEEVSFLTLLYMNAAYVEITKSFLCNLNVVIQSQTPLLTKLIIIASDKAAQGSIVEFISSENLHLIVHEVVHFPGVTTEAVSFGTQTYYDLTLSRLQLQNSLIQAGVSVLIIESDAVWQSGDVISFMSQEFSKGVDMISANDSGNDEQKLISAGFLLVNANAHSKAFFNRYTKRYARMLKRHILEGEQIFMTHLLKQERHEVSILWLNECMFASGRWYIEEAYREACPAPKVIQNNWVVGNANKTQRAQKWKHWYLAGDGSCIVRTHAMAFPRSILPKVYKTRVES